MIIENFIPIGSIWRETMADGRSAVAQVEVALLSWAVAVVVLRKYARRWHKPSPGWNTFWVYLFPYLHSWYCVLVCMSCSINGSSSLLEHILQHINRRRYPIHIWRWRTLILTMTQLWHLLTSSDVNSRPSVTALDYHWNIDLIGFIIK